MIEKLVRPELKDFIPYSPNQIAYRVKLDANEGPFDLPDAVKRKLAGYFSGTPELNLYPDSDSVELRKTLASYWETDFDGIVVGTGSDQLIQVLANVFAGKGEKTVCPAPSFSMYKMASIIAGGIPVEFYLDENEEYKYRPDEIINIANKEKARMIFLCTPNNPTGGTVPTEDIIRIVEACGESVIVVDEAYAEFSGETSIPLAPKYPNLIILRTFSKAYGLAGIRCGYSISSKEMANELYKIKPPYNISSLSQFIARLVFEERETIDMHIRSIIGQREYLTAGLKKIKGIQIFPSKANFLLVRIPGSGLVYNELVKRGILVRSFGNSPKLEDCLRITVGTREQNDILVRELKSILK